MQRGFNTGQTLGCPEGRSRGFVVSGRSWVAFIDLQQVAEDR